MQNNTDMIDIEFIKLYAEMHFNLRNLVLSRLRVLQLKINSKVLELLAGYPKYEEYIDDWSLIELSKAMTLHDFDSNPVVFDMTFSIDGEWLYVSQAQDPNFLGAEEYETPEQLIKCLEIKPKVLLDADKWDDYVAHYVKTKIENKLKELYKPKMIKKTLRQQIEHHSTQISILQERLNNL